MNNQKIPPDAAGAQLLQRSFLVLRALSSRQGGWRLGELAQYCGLHHSTLHRILAALGREEIVARDPHTRHYILGRLAYELGVAAQPRYDWRAMGAQSLDRLARHTGDTIFLNLRSRHETVCIDRREGHYPIKALTVEVGARRPLCVSAGGAAILARLPAEQAQALMQASQPYLARFSAERMDAILRLLETSRRLGYGYNRDMIVPRVSAVGVAVMDPEGTPVAALSIAAISSRLSGARLREVVDAMRSEARELELRLCDGNPGTAAAAGVPGADSAQALK
ncbi:IclR family transcriptional regulator [Candidimonas humi]|uniref:IclR family transcriptional regulator n=1 Tax=Candidimonas humi TaxID=683355 RepID=A0ABV8P280_9BURK|nr:IclR family transcriptional regulator [Candidimonas humi]MBV6307126.1 IclR family transcriptional regulator [Candidimonas humi]